MEKLIREIIATKIFKLTNENRAKIDKIEKEYKDGIEAIRKRIRKAVDSVKGKNAAAIERIEDLFKYLSYTKIKDYYRIKSLDDVYAISDDDYEAYLEAIAKKNFSKEIQEEVEFLIHLMNSQYNLINRTYTDIYDSSNNQGLAKVFSRYKEEIIAIISKIFRTKEDEITKTKERSAHSEDFDNLTISFEPEGLYTSCQVVLKSPAVTFEVPVEGIEHNNVFMQLRNQLKKIRRR